MLKKILVIIGIIIILGLIVAIFQKNSSTNNIEQSNALVGYWNFTEFSNEGARDLIPENLIVATAIFEDTGRISGIAFCNNYSGTYETEGSNITFGPMASTQKACEETIMELESRYLINLGNATNFEVDGENLYLKDNTNQILLTFNLRPEVSIEGTDWKIVGYNNGNQGVTTVIIGTKITANFLENNLSGTSGCNSYNASYSLTEENRIEIGIPAVTLVQCEEDVMEQEQQYISALQNSTIYQMTFDGLELRDDNGSLQVTMSSE